MAEQPKGNEAAYPPVNQAYPPPGQATYNPGNAEPSATQAPPPPVYPGSAPGPPQQAYGQPPPPAYAAQQPGYPQGGYPQQPGGHYPQQPAIGAVIVTQPATTMVINNTVMFRESPVNTTCPTCQKQVVTSTSFETGTMTWVACLILFFVGCNLGCCFIPFCVPSCKDVLHICPNCNAQIGRYNRM